MHTIRHCLQNKGSDVWSIHPDASVLEALNFMADKNIGALLVIEDGNLVGMFSERDYARKVILQGKSSRQTSVREIMSNRVFHIDYNQNIEDCMALMTEKHIRHLPVLQGDAIVGVISIGDVVKEIIAEQEFVINQLENYISGER